MTLNEVSPANGDRQTNLQRGYDQHESYQHDELQNHKESSLSNLHLLPKRNNQETDTAFKH